MRRPAAALLVTCLVLFSGLSFVGGVSGNTATTTNSPATPSSQESAQASNPCVGTVRAEPRTTTLVTIQGARGGGKTASLLVGVHPNGSVVGVHNDTAAGRWWLYDVDRLPNGNLLAATTEPGITVIEEVDPATGEHVSVTRLENVEDAHDADYLGDGEIVTVDKGDERNRVLVYNLTREEIVWEWRFENHTDRFPRSGGGPYADDWTHVNDVDEIRDGVFMISVRNFDQVVAIDRETKEIIWTLGDDDAHDVLFEQHNPDYLEGMNGTPTVLVADSRNDRVVEYAREDGEWVRTWVLEGGGLDDPRDADRLPNGNTLVVDRRGHRVLEVTPTGEVVWEFYTPWQPYDAERVGTGPGSAGPTMREVGATGSHRVTGSADFETADIEACYAYLTDWEGGSQLIPGAGENATKTAETVTTPWANRTFTGETDGSPGSSRVPLGAIGAGAVLALIVGGVAVRRWG